MKALRPWMPSAGPYARMNDHRAPPQKSALEGVWERQGRVEARGGARSGDHWAGYGGLNNFPCGEAAGMTAWLNVPAVQEALHVTTAHRKDGTCRRGPHCHCSSPRSGL